MAPGLTARIGSRFRTGHIEASADTYALACVLYQCLTGKLPFPGTTFEQIALAHLMDVPPKPSIHNPATIPAAMDEVIGIGLAKEPPKRYRSAIEFAAAARAALTTATHSPEPDPVSPKTEPPKTPPDQADTHAAPEQKPLTEEERAKFVRDIGNSEAWRRLLEEHRSRKSPVPQVSPATSTPRWRRRRTIIVVTLVVLVLLAGLAIGRTIIRNHYYVAEYNGKVSVVRGIQGSLLGISMHQPYLVACFNARNELSLISYGQSGVHLDCELLTLQDLSPAGQVQVQAGIPGGALDVAESQLRKLLADSLLTCPATTSQTVPAIPHCRAVA